MTTAEAAAINLRRLELVDRKYRGGGLTDAEQAELNACAAALSEWMTATGRLDGRREVLDEFTAWVAEIRAKVEARRAGDAAGRPPPPDAA